MTPVPSSIELASDPDVFEAGEVDLSGLDDVGWAELAHAHGSAEIVPEFIRLLAGADAPWPDAVDELFGDYLLHQGTCYSATAPAMAFIVRLLTSGTLPVRRRLDLYTWLLHATGRGWESVVGDADLAAAESRPPRFGAWTPDVHLAIGDELPALLARWSVEPPATRFFLACLAALHPGDGQPMQPEIRALAAATSGTQHGAYLELVEALLFGDSEQALALAKDIACWAGLDRGGLDAAALVPQIRALSVLTAGAVRT